jgi:hypothetical protein
MGAGWNCFGASHVESLGSTIIEIVTKDIRILSYYVVNLVILVGQELDKSILCFECLNKASWYLLEEKYNLIVVI